MTDYITRKAAIENVIWAQENQMDEVEALECTIAADVVPMRHGRWEFLGPNMLNRDCMCGTCSVCKVRSKYIVNTGLCPNCGAQMDGGES